MLYNNLLFFNKNGHQSNMIWNGEFWSSRVMLPLVSVNLFEIDHLFVVEKFQNEAGDTVYGYPHVTPNINNTTSPVGLYANFTAGSSVVIPTTPISSEYIGASIFTSQFPNGTYIVGIDTINNRITIADSATITQKAVPISFNLYRATFETSCNILDFDEFDPITCNMIYENDYITTTSDLSALSTSNYKMFITGNGIPLDARITSISKNRIYMNKKCLATLNSVNIYVYPIEDRNDVSDYLYQYNLSVDTTLDAPVLNKLTNTYFVADFDSTETINNGIRKTSLINSNSIALNLALNSPDEGIFGRTLVIQDLSLEYPKIIARIEIHGETIGEDERLVTLLKNFGRKLNSKDAFILRDSDPEEPYTDFILTNAKRKELLLEGHEIFPYIGSYKGLINAIKFFGYNDLTIKEYWLNIIKSQTQTTALQQNTNAVSIMQNQINSQNTLIPNIIDDENSGKYKQVIVYGLKPDGTYGLINSLEKIFPSSTYKKTSLFGLFYNINDVVPNEYDEYGYPVTADASLFTPEEVLLKLFALKEKLKQDYLPISAKIIDITGEGIYFGVYKQRLWVDNLKIDELHQGMDIDITSTPNYGYIEDLRPFQRRINSELPTLPFVGQDPYSYLDSTYGNTTDPNSLNSVLSPADSLNLATAIEKFYNERNHLGVDKYDLGDDSGYYKKSDGSFYSVPAGFPTVLEITSFNLAWDDISNTWDSLDRNYATYSTTIASYSDIDGYDGTTYISDNVTFEYDISTGFGALLYISLPPDNNFLNPSNGKLQLLLQSNTNETKILVELQSYNITNGNAIIKVLWVSYKGLNTEWTVNITNICKEQVEVSYNDYSFYNNGFYSWDNLRFAGFYEIEWTVTKKDSSPFNYSFRGPIASYYKIPIILPYIGKYSVRCRVWDGFNDICTQYYSDIINVDTRNIEVVNIARYNESEIYNWDNMKETWDDYNAPWENPSESVQDPVTVSSKILDFGRYGNSFNEGQNCKVLSVVPSVLATSNIKIGASETPVTEFTSNYSGGNGLTRVLLSGSYIKGEAITIIDKNTSGTNYSGSYDIYELIDGGFILQIKNAQPDYTKIFVMQFGYIEIGYLGKQYARVYLTDSFDVTIAKLMSTFNNGGLLPSFGIETFNPVEIPAAPDYKWYNVLFNAPFNSGSAYNNVGLTIKTTGSMFIYDGNTVSQNSSFYFSDGVNSYNDYLDFDFTGDLINSNMINYGTKGMTWDSFENIKWDDLYSSSWDSYDFHNDWLGGFSLYNIQNSDLIKVGIKNSGVIMSSTDNFIGLEEACRQLNASKDPGISKFTYNVRGFSKLPNNFDTGENIIGSPITTMAIPYNENTESYNVQYGSPLIDAPTSIAQNKEGLILLGGKTDVKIFASPDNIISYNLSTLYPGTSPRKIKVDSDNNWWCYGEMCDVPLIIYNRDIPDKTIFISHKKASYVTNSVYNLILDLPYTSKYTTSELRQFQVISLAFNEKNGNFSIYIKFQQAYKSDGNADYIFSLYEYNSSLGEFISLSTTGPTWNIERTYDNGSVCVYLGMSYVSLTDSNHSNIPTNSSIYWKHPQDQTMSALDTSIYSIRQLEYEHLIEGDKLWMATNDGIKVYDGIKVLSLDTSNSGIHSNDVYSLVFDEKNGKWFGTSNGITYYDNLRWGCWTNSSNPELPLGRSRNIINIGYGRIFFTIQTGNSTYKLIYFNGVNFKIYSTDPGEIGTYSPFPGMDYDYENVYYILNKYKYIENSYTAYPGDIFYIGDYIRSGSDYVDPGYWDFDYVGIFYDPAGSYLRKINYLVPYIHALAKNPGSDGWDFIYHISRTNENDPIKISEIGILENSSSLDLMNGPFSASLNSGKLPQLPYTDTRSWSIPSWINYNFEEILIKHPSINTNDLFLNAPLRDLISGEASKESYWRNSSIPRSSDVKSGNLINDFEWVLKMTSGTNQNNVIASFIDDDNYLYTTGYFTGTMIFGSKNNSGYGDVSLISNNCQSIYVSKYNQAGVIQWAQMYGENDLDTSTYDYDYTPSGIKVDNLGNIIVVGYNTKNRSDYDSSTILNDNIYLKWNWNGNLIIAESLFSGSDDLDGSSIEDLAIDKKGNLYITGEFTGTLLTGEFILKTLLDNDGYPLNEIFVARIDINGNVKWLNKLNTGGQEGSVSMVIDNNYEDLYIAFRYISADNTIQKIYFNKYTSYNFYTVFSKEIINTSFTNITEQHISISKKDEIVLGITYTGILSVDEYTLTSKGGFDICIFSINGYKINWAQNIGSIGPDYCNAVGINSSNEIFILGSYSAPLILSPDYTSPNLYTGPKGSSDIILFKYSNSGTLIDIVNSGGISADSGTSISFDTNDNIYITGYVNSLSNFNNWIISPSGGEDCFIGKILNTKYKKGKFLGNPNSLFGAPSLSGLNTKITKGEFEIPIGAPVIFNPIASYIPGKTNYNWVLKDDDSGNVIIDIKDVNYFIWKFDTPGFYTLYLSLEDSNGNKYTFNRYGYIRVIDHKKTAPGESIEYVNSDVYRKRSLYEINSNPQLV